MHEETGQPQIDPWTLVEQGRYQEALRAYTEAYEQDHRPFYLYNRATVYLLLNDYHAALADFERVSLDKEPRFRSDGEYFHQGICHWYLGQPAQAVAVWRESLTAPYTDAAGGVAAPALLLYAAERLQDQTLRKEAQGLLRKHARRKISMWPGPIVPFLLGKMEIADLEQAARASSKETIRIRHQCQADFYIALRALREDNQGLFEAHMRQCADSSYGLLEHEYYLARWEVQRGFPMPAFETV